MVPAPCAGCGTEGERLSLEVCGHCVAALDGLRAFATRPTPPPPGLPPCYALGDYGDELRELIIGFKDRGRHRLAQPLGGLLAETVATAVPEGPVLLVYVPDTGAAARERYGDHMRRMAAAAARRLQHAGRPAMVAGCLRARPKADSAGLDMAQRAEAARAAFLPSGSGRAQALRGARDASVILVDDVITTGVTLAAAAQVLDEQGIHVDACATLAATRRRMPA
ncbi:MAG: ComF family protein [Dehalococcoidia bacterium]